MKRDGICEVQISDDAMEARATFLPPLEDGSLLTPGYVESVLEAAGVVAGIDWEKIEEATFTANTEHRAIENAIVAVGSEPVAERSEHYRLVLPRTVPAETDEPGNDTGKVDHKAATRIVVVREGQVLARVVPAQEGQPGSNVKGEELPFGKETVTSPQPGENTTVEDDKVIAAKAGRFVYNQSSFHVEDRLELSEGVDYHTGSIEFPGDVVVNGPVKHGFHIWVGGSLEVRDTIDVSEIYCRKDFSCKGGVVGQGKRILRCGGRIQTRFIGNCYVESKSSIFVKDYIYQSHVSSTDRIAMEKNGRVIGGSVTAAIGIRCHQLGNDARVTTIARAGIDFITERKLRVTKERLEQLTIQLERLRKKAGHPPTARQVDVLDKVEAARARLTQQMSQLTESLDISEEATIEVSGTVHPGSVIQICRSSYVVEEPTSHVRFKLEKKTGQIIKEELET